MKRYLTVGIVFGVLLIAVVAISWFLIPSWNNPASGGFWALVGIAAVGVVTFIQGIVSIWKDLKEDQKTSAPIQSIDSQKADLIYTVPGGTINVYPDKHELSENLKQREQIFQERVLEAAIEKQVEVGISTQLFVWIKQLELGSIKTVISSIDEDIVLDEENIKSKRLEIEFPIEKDRILPVGITLRLTAHEFRPSIQQKKVNIPPEENSEVCTFTITPLKPGKLLLNFGALKDQVNLATQHYEQPLLRLRRKKKAH